MRVYPFQEAADHHAKVTLGAIRDEVGAAPSDFFTRPPEIETFEILAE
jgi:hypothetical protein